MDISDADRIKLREITFHGIHPDPNQAMTAARFLSGVDGILGADPIAPTLLKVSYDVLVTTLHEIEGALTELGLHLDSRMMCRLKRALYHYTEETLRANCGCPNGLSNCTERVFAKRYELIEHGCRDLRPEHWRRYL
ncbi:hypothetical protein CKO25_15095 [Thiocapsa imhoffii]|uniref:Uncharacterized protein n=1 Tax=Thiocapsa imhoffii TaxID=382777 RepID=A0A9X1BAC7_9GAMM|nr:hypothetical protein [Thiocapsa imhoffii]MBK1645951.1 hypothetical protein [Thiocapsa imhoffii]